MLRSINTSESVAASFPVMSTTPRPSKRQRTGSEASSEDGDWGAREMSVDSAPLTPGSDADLPPFRASQESIMSQTLALQEDINDDSCSAYLRDGFLKVNAELRNRGQESFSFSLDVFQDEFDLLKLASQHEGTMDSVSKSFQLIPSGDASNYMQPYEGAPLCYVERCNSMNTPPHICNVLFFYYALLSHVKANSLTGYVIPLENLTLRKLRNDKGVDAKKIVSVCEDMVSCNSDRPPQPYLNFGAPVGTTDIRSVLEDRDRGGTEHMLDRDPFSIRLAFTGAFYEVDGVTKQELFCVAVITPLKAFDLITYIKDLFQMPPKAVLAKDHWCHLDLCFKRIQMFEVNNNCGLLCDPSVYKNDIGGKGGMLSVLCMLNLPLRMAWIIQNLRQDESPSNIRIIGMPKLTFRQDGSMDQYLKYMNCYINEQVQIYEDFQRNVKVYYSTQEPEQSELTFNNIKSPGGWPLKAYAVSGHRQEYQRFGLFPFPLVMSFNYQIFVERPSKESFLLNLGQEPESVVKKKRDFATFDQRMGRGSVMLDSTILMSTEAATPLRLLDKYYGPNAKPAEDFKDTKLIKWYEAMRDHTQSLLIAGEITPDEAMVQIKRHIESCMEQHVCILKHDSYGSSHFEQCGKIVEKMLDTKLATVSVAANLRFIKETLAPRPIRHDTFLATSFSMLQTWVNYNKHASLYATNAEAALEILLSSMLWHLGSHSHTMTSFFQGVLLVSLRGHLEVLIDKLWYVDWRKPNSSGAGAIQVALNIMMEEMGRVFKIMPDDNKTVYINPNRNTMAALENECCVITVQTNVAEVKSRPSPDMKDMPLLMLENRGDYSLDTLIRFVFPRDAGQRNVAMTTMDLDKTNDRSVALKKQICFPNVSGFCTNQKKGTDEPKSLICVTHVCDPGAPAYYEIMDQSGDINKVQCELNDGRATMPTDTELYIILKQIFFSRVFTSVMVALPHRAGMLPFKINPTTQSLLDWLYMVIRSHVFCIFNGNMIENFGRIKVGSFFLFLEPRVAW